MAIWLLIKSVRKIKTTAIDARFTWNTFSISPMRVRCCLFLESREISSISHSISYEFFRFGIKKLIDFQLCWWTVNTESHFTFHTRRTTMNNRFLFCQHIECSIACSALISGARWEKNWIVIGLGSIDCSFIYLFRHLVIISRRENN